MENDIDKVEKIILQHGSYVKEIGEEISEGISQGVKEGVSDGLKRGVKDGLNDCLTKGFMNIGQDDIGDILEDIPREIIRNSVKEGAKHIFEKSTQDYLQKVCQRLVDAINKKDIKLPEDQTGHVLSLVKGSVREAVKKMGERLPNNPFIRELIAGMQTALEESLEENFGVWEERIHKEMVDES